MKAEGSIEDVGPFIVVKGYDDPLDLWEALLGHYLARRPMRTTSWGKLYPETTVGDVFLVAGLFDERLRKARPDLLGLAGSREAWASYRAELKRLVVGKLMHEPYLDNQTFWRTATRQLALDLSTSSELPRKAAVVLDAVKTTVGSLNVTDVLEDVVDTGGRIVKRGAEEVGDALQSIGSGAKNIVKGGVEGVGDAVIKPLVDAIGKPFLIGAAVVGGLIIVPKLLDGGARRE